MRLLRLKLAWLIDWAIPVRKGQVCFVSRRNAPINGNLRVMLDTLAAEPGLRVIAYKEGHTHPHTARVLQQQGVELIEQFSLQALITVLSSELVVLSHSARDAYLTRRKRGRRVVNLWHGVAIKRIEALMLPRGSIRAYHSRQRRIAQNSRIYDAVIASNPVDQLVNALAFAVPHQRVHPIGLPRFDYLLQHWRQWPEDLQAQRQGLEAQLKGRRLILYAPTFREGQTSLRDLISDTDQARIQHFCQNHHCALGIRPHPYWEGQQEQLCDGHTIIDAGTTQLPEPAVALSRAETLVADYSSIWVDYLILQRPVVGYMPDLTTYLDKERGFIYDYKSIFPGMIASDWSKVIEELSKPTTFEYLINTESRSTQKTLFLPQTLSKQSFASACRPLFANQAHQQSR